MTNHASKSGEVYPVNAVRSDFQKGYQFEQGFNQNIYKVESPDAIEPKGEGAKVLFRYKDDNKSAGICFDGNYHSVILGFPFETITTAKQRSNLLGEILKYWKLK